MGERFVRLIHCRKKDGLPISSPWARSCRFWTGKASHPAIPSCVSSPDDPLPAQSNRAMEIPVDRRTQI